MILTNHGLLNLKVLEKLEMAQLEIKKKIIQRWKGFKSLQTFQALKGLCSFPGSQSLMWGWDSIWGS